MARVITFSRQFPQGHLRAGQPTFFVEKILNSLGHAEFKKDLPPAVRDIVNDFVILDGQMKHHTIRAGHRWNAGEWFSPRVWGNNVNPKSGRSGPRQSNQITIGPDIEIKKVWDFEMIPALWADECQFKLNGNVITGRQLKTIATNDGLSIVDFVCWFAGPGTASSKRKPFDGQVITWSNIEY